MTCAGPNSKGCRASGVVRVQRPKKLPITQQVKHCEYDILQEEHGPKNTGKSQLSVMLSGSSGHVWSAFTRFPSSKKRSFGEAFHHHGQVVIASFGLVLLGGSLHLRSVPCSWTSPPTVPAFSTLHSPGLDVNAIEEGLVEA